MKRGLIILFVFFLFGFPCVCLGEDYPPLVFPFTVDQNIKSEDPSQIRADKDIQTDNWFMSPPTRLELLTIVMDQYFKNKIAEYWEYSSKRIKNNFEQEHPKAGSVQADAWVNFYNMKDLFGANVRIQNLGKPKKPMKEVCEEVLSSVSLFLIGGGYSYQNTFLAPFIQTSPRDPEVFKITDKLQKNILISVTLESRSDKDPNYYPKDYYGMRCYKFAGEKEIYFNKQSFRIDK